MALEHVVSDWPTYVKDCIWNGKLTLQLFLHVTREDWLLPSWISLSWLNDLTKIPIKQVQNPK